MMKRQGSFIRKNIFEGPLVDWCEFPDEALQYNTWNLNFDNEDDPAPDTDLKDDTEPGDREPNRYPS